MIRMVNHPHQFIHSVSIPGEKPTSKERQREEIGKSQ